MTEKNNDEHSEGNRVSERRFLQRDPLRGRTREKKKKRSRSTEKMQMEVPGKYRDTTWGEEPGTIIRHENKTI